MGQLSKEAVQRAYAICLIGAFQDGAYGRLRAHKVNFFAEHGADVRPFSVERHHYGQFSPELADTLEQLLSMQYLATIMNRGYAENEVNVYRVRDRVNVTACRDALRAIAPTLITQIQKAVANYGYLPEPRLRDEAYKHLEDVSEGDTVIEGTLPDRVDVPDLPEADCEELELLLSPDFIHAAGLLAEAFEHSAVDFDEVRVIHELPASPP